MTSYLRRALLPIVVLFILALATVNLDSAPPVWWDEGWTLSVARNWVIDGHYGRYLLGKHTPPGLEATFPVTASVALSFHLFGVGIAQARIPGLLFTLGALALIYYLARQLYNRGIAVAALALLVFTFWVADLHPVIMGRQAMGEMPALFFLLSGYAFFLSAGERRVVALPLAVFFWGAALVTKLQVFPFFVASLLVPMVVSAGARRWRTASICAIGLAAALTTARVLLWAQQFLLERDGNPLSPLSGLYSVTALVGSLQARLSAVIVTLLVGIPTFVGLIHAARSLIKDQRQLQAPTQTDIIRIALLSFAGSWFGWYLALSNGWFRYLFPATFIGAMFVAALLYDITEGFKFKTVIGRVVGDANNHRLNKRTAGVLLFLGLMALSVPLTLKMFYQTYIRDADKTVLQVMEFLNSETPEDALIETYDPEIFFLLKRPYHYPPDAVHVDLNRRVIFGQKVRMDYDPLTANPDYLVIGRFSRAWQVYDSVLQTKEFRLLKTFNRYQIYQRAS